jgi:hypothetical protein
MAVLLQEENWRRYAMTATSVREPEISSPPGERPLDLDEHQAVDRIAWELLQGAQNLRRWIGTVILVALAVLVVGFFLPSP